jgi:hypothetical protein
MPIAETLLYADDFERFYQYTLGSVVNDNIERAKLLQHSSFLCLGKLIIGAVSDDEPL